MGRSGSWTSLFCSPKGALTHHYAFRHSGGISYGKRALSEGMGLPPLAPAKPFVKGLSENFSFSLRSAFLERFYYKNERT